MRKNPKIEYRNPKQFQNPKYQNPKPKWHCLNHSNFGHLDLFRISDFVL